MKFSLISLICLLYLGLDSNTYSQTIEPDIINLKKSLGPSNSGMADVQKYFFRPDTSGFYYYYFNFNRIRIPGNVNAIVLYTFKFGATAGDFYDVNEEWIMLKSMISNEALGDYDLVGLNIQEIQSKFGLEYLKQDSLKAFKEGNQILICHFEIEKVDWFKLLKVNSDFQLEQNLPEDLKKY